MSLTNQEITELMEQASADAILISLEEFNIHLDKSVDSVALIDDILSVEGKKDYVKLQLDSKSYLVRKNLKTFLMDLPSSKFARISKSVAVNLEKISKIEKNIVYLNSEDYHLISKNYVNDINDLLI